ncbi:SO2930 family diheme c-type cytochrome [Sphingopyxis sp. KK2]|uniref:SO2930 family diheme c-type cytochrome n=1 Tax=Sphingopyxis sp. KK2 TaxID=1855727 RepID=UPI00097E567C|nr:SO2930 family diheme c-type cytochrome [Sphingopyxis sp. KK2]
MKRIAAALAAALLSIGAKPLVQVDLPNQSVIDGSTTPAKLSAFGLFERDSSRPALGPTPYTLRTPLFSDYADKSRLFWIPLGKKARVDADGTIIFPVGSVIVKSFGWASHNEGRPVETRLLIHRAEGWVALPYVWDADGRDATLALGGRRVPINFTAPDGKAMSINYAVPNKNQCKECHALAGAIQPIGPKARNFVVATNGLPELLATQFANPEALNPVLPVYSRPETGSVAERARAYLDVNCAHCHNPAGSASNSGLFLRWTDDPAGVNYGIGKRPTAAGRGSGGMDFAIAPGDPDHSYMIYRLESTDPGIAMPEVGRSTVHKEGAALLRQWIAQMPKDGQKPAS